MGPKSSFLSNPKYGYDFVVATTQASINSGLLEYISDVDEPVTYLCFMLNVNTGAPQPDPISLTDLMQLTDGVNPFDIPAGTAYEDPRVLACANALFVCGIAMQMGLPSDTPPKDLKIPIVSLGNSANNVQFTMYCSQFQVVEITYGLTIGTHQFPGKFNVWEQPAGDPWYVQTLVDLVTQDLDKELNTPYFNKHPAKKQLLLDQLNNLSGTAFSLQQLLFDLDNAALQTVPTFQGLPKTSNAASLISKNFVQFYSVMAKNRGLPLLSVNAVAHTGDSSQLHLTAFEREVSVLVDDGSGVPISNPTPLQQSATTLSYLCAVDGHSLPGIASFDWNWVEPNNINAESGVIAINRNVMANFILQQLLPSVTNSCIATTTSVDAHALGKVQYHYTIQGGQQPNSATVTPSGSTVISIAYDQTADNSDRSLATYGELEIANSYKCDVSFSGNSVTVVQSLQIYVYAQWDSTDYHFLPVRKTITDVYTLQVGQNGSLQMTGPISSSSDTSERPSVNWFSNFFTGLGDLLSDVDNAITGYSSTNLQPIPFGSLQNFIFPGARVFTYKNARFSKNQDLICDITYRNPNTTQAIQSMHSSQLNRLANLPKLAQTDSASNTIKYPSQMNGIFVPEANIPKQPNGIPAAPQALFQSNGISPLKMNGARNADAISSSSSTTIQLKYSSEMMQNYLQGEIVSPQGKFEALQTDNGCALLFAMDTSGVLHVIEEQSGKTSTGWVAEDLSTTILSKMSGARLQTFDVGQSVVDGTVGIAMAVTNSGGSSTLLVSSGNSSSDLSWTKNPAWTLYPFDASNEISSISIVNIMFSETYENVQYLVVDIDRSATSSVKDITRYYVDPTKKTGRYWIEHDVSVDIQDGNYQSCVGRTGKAWGSDGVYTSGLAGSSAQLVYTPMHNVFGSGPPLPSLYYLPNQVAASAIAAARNTNRMNPKSFGTTDLYAIGGSTLYHLSPTQQEQSGTQMIPLITHTILNGTDKLVAMTHDGVTTLWGRNASDQVYYLSCSLDQLSVATSWSAPVPLLSGIEKMSPFLNRTDGGNTIFASGNNELFKIMQATGTSSKLWKAHDIHLAAAPKENPVSFNSYTTTIILTDANNLPARDISLTITTESRSPVYVNGLYYVLGPVPVRVTTDPSGMITIIEATSNVNGTTLTVETSATSAVVINPMDKPFNKIATLNSVDALKNATFSTNTKAGGTIGAQSQDKLVTPSAQSNDVQALADNMTSLRDAYDGSSKQKPQLVMSSRSHVVMSSMFFGISDDIAIAAGDLYQWLKSGVEAAVQLVKDTASDAWHFVASIAGKVYRAVLSSAEAVVGAVEWVFNAIGTAIRDLIRFLEFLFDWDNIKRTKEVIHNIVILFMQHMTSEIKQVEGAFNKKMGELVKEVAKLTGVQDWSPLADSVTQPVVKTLSNPHEGQTSGSQMFSHHFKNNAKSVSVVGQSPTLNFVEQLFEDLLNAIMQEGDVLAAVYHQFRQLAQDFGNMTLEALLLRIMGILSETVLSSAQVVIDALLNVLSDVANLLVDYLDTEIYVPIISDILKELGVPSISYLDVITWIAAVAYTVPYEILTGEVPFPDNDDTSSLINVADWSSLQQLFLPLSQVSSTNMNGFVQMSQLTGRQNQKALKTIMPFPQLPTLPTKAQEIVWRVGHGVAAGTMALFNCFSAVEASDPEGSNDMTYLSAFGGLFSAVCCGATDALVPKDPIATEAVRWISNLTVGLTFMAKIYFAGMAVKENTFTTFGSKTFEKFLTATSTAAQEPAFNNRAAGAIVNTILVFPAMFCSVWHCFELAHSAAGDDKTQAILTETANFSSYLSRMCYTAAVCVPVQYDPTKALELERLTFAASMTGFNEVQAVILAIQAIPGVIN